ncbi:MAG: MarR family transcriptional regulator [Myxococcaceae bacterium]|nr:MarR family transcriptional regulator [Myxococcaceae bacterium]MCI0669183.1 MarR family transcriptional regulator [Myxococcaceae bacterium]
MKGYLWSGDGSERAPETSGRLERWEAIAVDAVGNVIEFWGFKRNQGRVWALLYLRGTALTAADIERELALSKGGVSMLLRDLEGWGVVQRTRLPGETAWHYRAESDFMRMVARVIEQREAGLLGRIRADLQEALALAITDGEVRPEQRHRLERMAALAEQVDRAVRLFLKTARLDVGAMLDTLREESGGTPGAPR